MSDNWGGFREGSGRKIIDRKNKKKGYTFQLTEEEVSFIEAHDGKSRSEALRKILHEFKNLKK
ncbi:hypothetical protein [Paucisalibacillus sp. EB02]|uniref:hypothetical protein n=1 Tax=Paucisalibacillus sp. EB02 TaxID=1347087 RepID=UPI0005A689E3|nr:hypothetical protein [Paucisalibacillus sp. EB02]